MARNTKPNAGIIGLGLIGSRAASNLRRAGYQVWVWSRSPRPEPNFLSAAVEVAESAKVIEVFVSDGPALIKAVESMASALGPEHVIINHATVSPKETQEAARIAQGRHAAYLDAPFTGTRDAAEAGQLVFYIGGDTAVLEKVRGQLEVNSRAILPVGEIGQAAALKIATNLIAAVTVGAYAEALSLVEKSGIPLYKLGEAFQQHGVHCKLGDMKIPAMITDDFEPRFALKHMFKDVQIALSMAEEHGIDLPEAAAFAGAAMAGLQSGWGDLDFSSIARHYGYPNEQNELPQEIFGEAQGGAAGDPAEAAPKPKKMFPLFGAKK